jgi:hypothetical protein
LPYFADKIASSQLGINNVYLDDDGVVRRYSLSPSYGGWRVLSLPMQLAKASGYPVPAGDNRLINWRGPPYSFRRVSFSKVYASMLADDRASLSQDFGAKIVLIGSTAVGLFDAKASPMASVHPGVEILATVIDNLKNENFIHEIPDWIYVVIALSLIWALAFAFRNRADPGELDTLFFALQAFFILFAGLALSVSTQYVDLATPVMFPTIYYFVAQPYALYEVHLRANRAVLWSRAEKDAPYRFAAMAIRSADLKTAELRSLQHKLDHLIKSSTVGASKLDDLFLNRGYISDVFNQTTLVYWLVSEAEGGATRENIAADATRIVDELRKTTSKTGVIDAGHLRFGFQNDVVLWKGEENDLRFARKTVLSVLRQLDAPEAEPASHVTASRTEYGLSLRTGEPPPALRD